ncbi:MAG: protein-disulfide isomerase [Acidimicrobiales bacterium]|nr:MAG: protein-disulfide isomerase [Acidimicrobiales bacterium]
MTTSFAVNWDYRCPYARNAHEHVVTALGAGSDWNVDFVPFSLSQVHVEEAQPDAWDDPEKVPDLLALQVGVVVRDRWPDAFREVHLALFAARHDEARDIRQEAVLRQVLDGYGIDPDQVFAEVADGWPLDVVRKCHEAAVSEHQAFGVPTFVVGDQAAFVRIMNRPQGDAEVARATVERVLHLVSDHPELNEVKHTTTRR